MSATNFTPIQLYRTSTAAAVPIAGNLAAGELAINLTDEALYFKNAAGVVTLLADSSGALGSVTSVAVSGGTTGLTTSGGPITSSGTITLAGTLAVANGGTGVTTSTGTTNVVLSNSPTLVTPTLGAASATSIANALGAVGTPSYTFTGDLNSGMWSPAVDTIAFSTNGAESMRIDSAGQVGIGTASPGAKLEVAGSVRTTQSTGGVFNMQYTTANANSRSWQINHDVQAFGDFSIQQSTTQTGSTYADRLLIDSTGNVGINTTTPGARLHVSGTEVRLQGSASFYSFYDTAGTTRSGYFQNNAGSIALVGELAQPMTFWTSNTERMRIDSSGNVGIGTSSPGAKLDVNGTIQVRTSGFEFGRILTNNVSASTGGLTFQYNAGGTFTDGVVLNGSGDVGIGTSSPSAYGKLTVNGNIILGAPPARNAASSNYIGIATTGDPSDDARANIAFTTVAGAASSSSLITFSTNNYGVSGGERMRIDSSGNVGIGTSAPGYRLDVASGDTTANIGYAMRLRSNATATAAALQFTNSAVSTENGVISCTDAGALTIVAAGGSSNIKFRTNGAERASISSDGHFGMGTSTRLGSNETLSVSAISTFDGMWVKNLAAAAVTAVIWNAATSGDNSFISFATEAASTGRGSITYNRTGGLVVYNTTSDYRAKDILGPVTDAGVTIDALKVYNGKMHGATITRPMLIAHEAQEVTPYAVTGEKDAVNEDGTDKHQQMDVSSLVPLLIAEIQSLRARVAQLEGN